MKKQKKESQEDLKKRASSILGKLIRTYPEASTALKHSSALELLIATILSAQCTDARVNIVTKDLYKLYRTAEDYAAADRTELEGIIRSTGFYHAKAKNIVNCCKMLVERFKNEIPDSLNDLVLLPGVGRKTANVLLGNFFGKAEGIVVDTHVKRLSQRMGFSTNADPENIEQDLMLIVPRKNWIAAGNILICHGRKYCTARKPKCPECPVNQICPSAVK